MCHSFFLSTRCAGPCIELEPHFASPPLPLKSKQVKNELGSSFLVRPSCSVEVKRCVLPLCLPGRSQTFSRDCSVGMKILEVHKLDMPWYMSSWAILGERSFVSEITPFLGSIVTQFYSIYLYMPIQELMAPKGKFPCKHFLSQSVIPFF